MCHNLSPETCQLAVCLSVFDARSGEFVAVSAGKAVAPFRPEVLHSGGAGNYEPYTESFDDPHSPMLDLAQARRIFRGF